MADALHTLRAAPCTVKHTAQETERSRATVLLPSRHDMLRLALLRSLSMLLRALFRESAVGRLRLGARAGQPREALASKRASSARSGSGPEGGLCGVRQNAHRRGFSRQRHQFRRPLLALMPWSGT